jgi:hypothetical protein
VGWFPKSSEHEEHEGRKDMKEGVPTALMSSRADLKWQKQVMETAPGFEIGGPIYNPGSLFNQVQL